MVSCFYTLYTSSHNSVHDHESSTIIEKQTFNGHVLLTGWCLQKSQLLKGHFFTNNRSAAFIYSEEKFCTEMKIRFFFGKKVSLTRHSPPPTPVTFFSFSSENDNSKSSDEFIVEIFSFHHSSLIKRLMY